MRRLNQFAWLTLFAVTAQAQTPRPAVDRPAQRGTAQVLTNTFSAVAFGAKADGTTDSAPAIQRAIDAAAVAAGKDSGAVVHLAGSARSYMIGSPLRIKGRGVTFRGDGIGSQIRPLSGYAGPILCIGLPAGDGEIGADYRPSSLGILDSSANLPRSTRRGLATRGKASVLFHSHPLQLGGRTQKTSYFLPDYWEETEALTVEFLLARPVNAVWKPGNVLMGMPLREQPAPWRISIGDGPGMLTFSFQSNEVDSVGKGAFYEHEFSIGTGRGPWRITAQVGFKEGRFAVWVNGKKVPVKFRVPSDKKFLFRPGLALHAQDGATAFRIGCEDARVVTALNLHGLRVTAAAVYRWDARAEVRLDKPSEPVRDQDRYFTALPRTVAFLPLDDPPGPPTIRSANAIGFDLGYWVPKEHRTDTYQVEVRDVQLWGATQPALVIGEHMGLKIQRVRATEGWQGIGRLPLALSYVLFMEDCTLSGLDCAFFSYRQVHHASNTWIHNGGRDTVRIVGGQATWMNTFIGTLKESAQTAFHLTGDDTGGRYRLTDTIVDNEGGGPRRAIIAFEQGNSPGQHLIVDGMDISSSGDAAILELIGHGHTGWWPVLLDAKAISSWGKIGAVLRVKGQLAFHGRLDTSELNTAKVEGGELAEKITIIPRPFPR
ncbi:MAG: hypothetical protein NVSMB9_27150 [Isosphaeraceae bacterium]